MVDGINSYSSILAYSNKNNFNIYSTISNQIYDKYNDELDSTSANYQNILDELESSDIEIQNNITKMQIGSNTLDSVKNLLNDSKILEIKYNQSESEADRADLLSEFEVLKDKIVDYMDDATFEGNKLFEIDGNITSFHELAFNGNDITIGEVESNIDLDEDGIRYEGEGTGLSIDSASNMVESLKDEVDSYLNILDSQASVINTQISAFNKTNEYTQDNSFEEMFLKVSMKALTMQNSLFSFESDNNLISNLSKFL